MFANTSIASYVFVCILLSGFWPDLVLNKFASKQYNFIWKLSRNKAGILQNIFKYHSDLKTILKSPVLDLSPDFSIFEPH